jgi:hypothetical protein
MGGWDRIWISISFYAPLEHDQKAIIFGIELGKNACQSLWFGLEGSSGFFVSAQ